MRVAHSHVIWSGVRADLRRLRRPGRTRIGKRRVDLRRCGPTSVVGRPSDTTFPRARTGGTAGGRLRRESAWGGTLVLRLERRLLRWRRRRRRRTLKPRGRLGHLLVGWWALLFLRRGRGRNWASLATLATHDCAEGVGAHPDRWRGRLRRAWMRRADHGVLRGATAGLIELATEMSDLFFVPV